MEEPSQKSCVLILSDAGEFVGAMVPCKSGNTLIAGRRHFAFLDWKTGALGRIAEIDADKPENRFNDGKCDPAGRFWAGVFVSFFLSFFVFLFLFLFLFCFFLLFVCLFVLFCFVLFVF